MTDITTTWRDSADLTKARADLAAKQAELDTAMNTIANLKADWQRLNAFLNAYADAESMCEGYEDTLAQWNRSFTDLQLVGRTKTYQVRTRVTLHYDVDITVRANNDAQARDKVNDMCIDDVMQDVDTSDYDDYEWTAGRTVEVES